jgi:hypothetical protein
VTSSDGSLTVYFGHHKCASQWMKRIVRAIAERSGLNVRSFTRPAQFNHDLNSIPEPSSTIVCWLTAQIDHAQRALNIRGWHMVRDPRDIVVSAYFSHLYSHPTGTYPGLEDLRTMLAALPKEEGLLLELQRRGRQFRQLARWDYEQPNVLEVRMEDVTAEPFLWLRKVLRFVGLYDRSGIDDNAIGAIVAENDFRVLAGGRVPGEEDVRNHYRKGLPGDWRAQFGPEHIAYFKEHYNPLLLKLGYEQTPDWV